MSTTATLPPGPKSRVPGRVLVSFRRDTLAFLTRAKQEYGDVAFWQAGPSSFALLSHPDYLKAVLVTRQAKFIKSRGLQRAKRFLGDGLLTVEGDAHRRQRRMSQPAFHKERVASYGAAMVEYAEAARERFEDGRRADLSHEMMRL